MQTLFNFLSLLYKFLWSIWFSLNLKLYFLFICQYSFINLYKKYLKIKLFFKVNTKSTYYQCFNRFPTRNFHKIQLSFKWFWTFFVCFLIFPNKLCQSSLSNAAVLWETPLEHFQWTLSCWLQDYQLVWGQMNFLAIYQIHLFSSENLSFSNMYVVLNVAFKICYVTNESENFTKTGKY